MKKLLVLLLMLNITMTACATTDVTDLTEDINPTSDDMLYSVNDPSGTPADRKVSVSSLQTRILTTDDGESVGLGPVKGQVQFNDLSTDTVNILNANVGIGTSVPTVPLDVNGAVRFRTLVSCNTIDTDASGNAVCGSDATGGSSSGINWPDLSQIIAIDPTMQVLIHDATVNQDKAINWDDIQPAIYTWEGTDDANETTITFEDPTADNSLIVQDGQSGYIIPTDKTGMSSGYGVVSSCSGGKCKLITSGSALPSGGGTVSFSGSTPSDNAIVRYDSTTGVIVQASLCTISDLGVLTCPSFNATTLGPITNTGDEASDAEIDLVADQGDDSVDTYKVRSTASTNNLDFLNSSTNIGSFTSGGRFNALLGFNIAGTTCLSVSADEIYHDTNCNSSKDSGEEFIDQVGAAGSGSSISGCNNLIVSYSSATAVTVSADNCILLSSTTPKLYQSVSETCTITTSGIQGLEASDTEGSSKWYDIQLRGKSDGTIDCLLNEAGTSVTTVPSGYTYLYRVGSVRNDGSSNFVEFYQAGREVSKPTIDTFTGKIDTSYTDLDFSGYAPPTARRLMLSVYNNTGGAISYFRRNGAAYDEAAMYVATSAYKNAFSVGCDSAQVVEYKVTSGSANIDINGYVDNL